MKNRLMFCDTFCVTDGSKGTSSTLPRPPERDSMKVHHRTFMLSLLSCLRKLTMTSPSQSKPSRSRTMKEILDERRTGSMVVPAWIETSDDANSKPVLLDPMLSLLSPSLLGDRRAFKKKRKAKIVISALVKAILDGDDDLIFFQKNRENYNKLNYEVGYTAFHNIVGDLINNGHLIRVSDPSAMAVDNLAPRYRPSDELFSLIPDQELEFEELQSGLKHDPHDDLTYKPIKYSERTKSKAEKAKGLRFIYEKATKEEWNKVSDGVVQLRRAMAEHDYSGIIIEGRSAKFQPLKRHFKSNIEGYGRYHSPVQSMSSATRLDILRINDEVCCEIDIVSSIPSVLFGLYVSKNRLNDRECFDYYQAVVDVLPELTRDAVKTIFTSSLGNGELTQKQHPKALKDYHPDVASTIPWQDIKSAMMTGMPQIGILEKRHMDWAYLYYLESEVLRVTMEQLLEHGIGVLPIHDSIIVPLKHREQAEQIYRQVFYDQLGVWPMMKVKHNSFS